MTGPDDALDLRFFTFSDDDVRGFESWRTYDTFENLFALRDGPFVGYGTIRWFDDDGRRFLRVVKPPDNRFADVEMTADGMIGEVRPVPPLEAVEEARTQGWLRA